MFVRGTSVAAAAAARFKRGGGHVCEGHLSCSPWPVSGGWKVTLPAGLFGQYFLSAVGSAGVGLAWGPPKPPSLGGRTANPAWFSISCFAREAHHPLPWAEQPAGGVSLAALHLQAGGFLGGHCRAALGRTWSRTPVRVHE